MTRGLGGQSPANVTHFLKGIEFPASKDDLLEHAKENDAEDAVCEMIEKMPDADYQSMADVMRAYGEADTDAGGDMSGQAHRQY
jgi:hypothetical protein